LIAFIAAKETNYGNETNECCADAVRFALTSGLTRRRVASDLGVGLSTLNKWVTAHLELMWCRTRNWTLSDVSGNGKVEGDLIREGFWHIVTTKEWI